MEEALRGIFRAVSLKEEDREARADFRDLLEDLCDDVLEHYRDGECRIMFYGSFISGTSTKSSDLNLYIPIEDYSAENAKRLLHKMVAALTSRPQASQIVKVKQFRRNIFLPMLTVQNRETLIVAKIIVQPMANFRIGRGDRAIQDLLQYDKRAQQLAVLVKHLVASRGMNEVEKNHLSSYCWMTLLVFFLQRLHIVPPYKWHRWQEMQEEEEEGLEDESDDVDDLFDPPPVDWQKRPERENAKLPLHLLLQTFLQFVLEAKNYEVLKDWRISVEEGDWVPLDDEPERVAAEGANGSQRSSARNPFWIDEPGDEFGSSNIARFVTVDTTIPENLSWMYMETGKVARWLGYLLLDTERALGTLTEEENGTERAVAVAAADAYGWNASRTRALPSAQQQSASSSSSSSLSSSCASSSTSRQHNQSALPNLNASPPPRHISLAARSAVSAAAGRPTARVPDWNFAGSACEFPCLSLKDLQRFTRNVFLPQSREIQGIPINSRLRRLWGWDTVLWRAEMIQKRRMAACAYAFEEEEEEEEEGENGGLPMQPKIFRLFPPFGVRRHGIKRKREGKGEHGGKEEEEDKKDERGTSREGNSVENGKQPKQLQTQVRSEAGREKVSSAPQQTSETHTSKRGRTMAAEVENNKALPRQPAPPPPPPRNPIPPQQSTMSSFHHTQTALTETKPQPHTPAAARPLRLKATSESIPAPPNTDQPQSQPPAPPASPFNNSPDSEATVTMPYDEADGMDDDEDAIEIDPKDAYLLMDDDSALQEALLLSLASADPSATSSTADTSAQPQPGTGPVARHPASETQAQLPSSRAPAATPPSDQTAQQHTTQHVPSRTGGQNAAAGLRGGGGGLKEREGNSGGQGRPVPPPLPQEMMFRLQSGGQRTEWGRETTQPGPSAPDPREVLGRTLAPPFTIPFSQKPGEHVHSSLSQATHPLQGSAPPNPTPVRPAEAAVLLQQQQQHEVSVATLAAQIASSTSVSLSQTQPGGGREAHSRPLGLKPEAEGDGGVSTDSAFRGVDGTATGALTGNPGPSLQWERGLAQTHPNAWPPLSTSERAGVSFRLPPQRPSAPSDPASLSATSVSYLPAAYTHRHGQLSVPHAYFQAVHQQQSMPNNLSQMHTHRSSAMPGIVSGLMARPRLFNPSLWRPPASVSDPPMVRIAMSGDRGSSSSSSSSSIGRLRGFEGDGSEMGKRPTTAQTESTQESGPPCSSAVSSATQSVEGHSDLHSSRRQIQTPTASSHPLPQAAAASSRASSCPAAAVSGSSDDSTASNGTPTSEAQSRKGREGGGQDESESPPQEAQLPGSFRGP